MDHNKMLIDATHPEETRVVVLKGGRVEEFDFESAARKLLRGNIYLAKVTRVEPSLQAAFVEYGGNRHGFLAFSEIHPDYYQIPVADRQALLDEEAAARREADEDRDGNGSGRSRRRRGRRDEGAAITGDGNGDGQRADRDSSDDISDGDVRAESGAFDTQDAFAPARPDRDRAGTRVETDGDNDDGPLDHVDVVGEAMTAWSEPVYENVSDGPPETDVVARRGRGRGSSASPVVDDDDAEGDDPTSLATLSDVPQPKGLVEDVGVEDAPLPETIENGQTVEFEQVGSEDALEEVPERPRRRARTYKIQEVIKRRQIILVQVVKEERGTKGAALTTYLSLAGRYTVLMPNTDRGGGISRKITNPQDRKRLKSIADELEVPEGMGLIIRTAGAARTKQEIRRDFEYLLRLWESVREMTLSSTAPSLVYEEGDLIKRSIRDLYTKDTDEIIVAGDAAHGDALDFMRMLMPSQAESVRLYRDPEPLFARFQIERQLNAMFSPYVTLRSGGYIVINQTEALVAIDVNSGKATREFSIEETALVTNLEASDEIARQLKLRDLAGLIVIDFIDMEERRNNRKVEQRLKDALRHDRARIQVGRISHFGLLEMSRQRMRTGVLEGSTSQCPHCQGTGIIRSTESVALAVLRGLEDALLKDRRSAATAVTTAAVALYILNQKRTFILDMERRYGVPVAIEASDRMQGANFAVERAPLSAELHRPIERAAVSMEWAFPEEGERVEPEESDDLDQSGTEAAPPRGAPRPRASTSDRTDDSEGHARRRRRRRRGGRRDERGEAGDDGALAFPTAAADEQPFDAAGSEPDRVRSRPASVDVDGDSEPAADGETGAVALDENNEGQASARRGRRRGRRGGRRSRGDVVGEAMTEGAIDRSWISEPVEGEVMTIGFPSPDAMPETLVAVFDPANEPQPVIEAWPEQPDRARIARPRRPRGERPRRDDSAADIVSPDSDASTVDAGAAEPTAAPSPEMVPSPAPRDVPAPAIVQAGTGPAPRDGQAQRAPRTADRIATIVPIANVDAVGDEPVPDTAPAGEARRGVAEVPLEEAAMGPSADRVEATSAIPRDDAVTMVAEAASPATPREARAMADADVKSASAGDVPARAEAAPIPSPAAPPAPAEVASPTRRGWWQRRFSGN